MATKKVEYKLDTKNIWFRSQVEPEPTDRVQFKTYWEREIGRIKDGFHIADGQVYIPGWLYWHTVYWIIELDAPNSAGRKYKTRGTPLFRDIEWEVANDLERAEVEGKTYCLVGSRGFGKSNICASVSGRVYNFFNDSETVVSGGFAADIKLLTDKADLGLSNCHPVFHKQRILNNWKLEVRAGWKDSETGLNKGSNSRIVVRNYEEGNNTMAANGTRPKVHIIDEIGKIPNLINCVLDTDPCWKTASGDRLTVAILAGTGGDMEKGADAATMFRDPNKYYILEFDDEWEGQGKIGKFVPVTKALNDYKDKWTLYDYLTKKMRMTLSPHPDLDIEILVSNEQRVMDEFVTPRRKKLETSITSNEMVKEKAYYPLIPSESFLVVSANDFPVEACSQHKQWIERTEFKPFVVEIYENLNGQPDWKHNDKDTPVREFPVRSESDKTGAIEMIEPPIKNPPYGLYVAGIDPYKQSESEYSDSLGSCYIFKRMTDSVTEPYQYMPVCWYTGRPKSIHTWYENVRLMLKLYSASAMCENADYGFIQYMIEKNETIFLAEGQSFLKELNPNTKHKSTYGLPATLAVINHANSSSVIYTKESFFQERDERGQNVGDPRLGVTRVLDIMLLEEMIKFNKHKGNFDRVRAFGLALIWAKQMDAIIPRIKLEVEYKEPKKMIRSPFAINISSVGRSFGSPSASPFNKKF